MEQGLAGAEEGLALSLSPVPCPSGRSHATRRSGSSPQGLFGGPRINYSPAKLMAG